VKGHRYGQETLDYPVLLIVLQHCTVNISAADMSGHDFTTAGKMFLNRGAVPCGSDSASQPLPPSCPIFDPFSSVITNKDDIYVALPTTYVKDCYP
jgi:hypothetical protein